MSSEQLDLFGFSKGNGLKIKQNVAVKPVGIKTKKEKLIVVENTELKPKKAAGKRGRKSFKETYSDADLVDVPADEVLQQKLYYSISEVAKWFRVTNSQIRFWENEFSILKPRKNRKGDRQFRPEDIKNLKLIYHLLRTKKLSLEGAKEHLKTNHQQIELQMQLSASLTKFKNFLLELKSNLES